MSVIMDQMHNIIYRTLFDMDSPALLIHFNLPANTYIGDDDDELLDSFGTLALNAVSEIQTMHYMWLNMQPDNGVTPEQSKAVLRLQAEVIAKRYKQRAKELGGDLLTEMRL
jgi:hypothetical protein